ncbi:hypothetical protein B0I35DRAFT_359293 [Stachybotrys elegans]|uniref:Fe2OG dioxygenase domain-containing protein n=1 Tax=Stachybotrys elegans TaxID=80388 RepID=A0A8K0SMV7_9HYPO|nr:hypothetical protein B0I35DRAFT_359293 [Stachybotrys elegans]
MAPELFIPIIDFTPLKGEDTEQEPFIKAGQEIYEGFKNFGFAYIKNHSVPQDVVDEAFEWSQRFFALPQSEKDKVPHPPEGWYHRGYSGLGREKVTQMVFDTEGIAQGRKKPDSKESFDMGLEKAGTKVQNIWPKEEVLPGFRDFFIRFYEVCYEMELKLLRGIAVGMGLDKDFFLGYHKNKNNQIRLLHYPPVEEALLSTGKVDSIGAHTDFGTLTMLFQDSVGGLEVEDIHEKGKFNAAPPIPGTMVVNIGDFLMRWSNDELRSTVHHVRAPPADRPLTEGKPLMTRERYSIPYFVSADNERTIDCLPGCWGPDRPKKYEPINSMEYLEMRLNATY